MRCIVIGIAHYNYLEDPNLKTEYDQIIKRNKTNKRDIYILADALSININHKCSVVEIMKAQEYLEILKILILFTLDQIEIKKLFHHNDHYDNIKSLPAFFNKDKFFLFCLFISVSKRFFSCVC